AAAGRCRDLHAGEGTRRRRLVGVRGDRGRRGGGGMSESGTTDTETIERDVTVVATRPTPGTPRPYDFPEVERTRLANGLSLIVANLPGRPLVSASLILRN